MKRRMSLLAAAGALFVAPVSFAQEPPNPGPQPEPEPTAPPAPVASPAPPVAAAGLRCEGTLPCTQEGLCEAKAGMCRAASAHHCAASLACTSEGRCTLAAGRCVARSDKACRAARTCVVEGRCYARDDRCSHAPAPVLATAPFDPGYGEAPERIPYRGGRVPKGFHVETEPKWGLFGAGTAVAGGFWLVSMITAVALDAEPDGSGDPNFDGMYAPMFVPVIGPFLTIGTADSSGTGAAILALDGAIQTAGLAMAIGALVKPDAFVAPDIEVGPMVGQDRLGLTMKGKF